MKILSRAIISLLFFAANAVFWAVLCPGYLLSQEWFQLFQFTPEYFLELVATPGGLGAWCGRLLMEFYCFPWAGGIVIAAVLCGIQLLVFSLARSRNSLSYALSFIPAVLFLVLCCAGESFLTPAVSCLLCLIPARITTISPKWLQVFITPLIWFLFGPFSLIYIAACIFSDRKIRMTPASLQLALWILCPSVWCLFDLYQFKNLLFGLYTTRQTWSLPIMACIVCLLSMASVVAVSRRLRDNTIVAGAVYVFCLALAFWGVREFISFRYGNLMKYASYANNEQWDAIIEKSQKDRVSSDDVHLEAGDVGDRWNVNDIYQLRYCMTALAYAQRGQLVDSLFSRFCPGPEGLFPVYEKASYLKNLLISDVYYHLSMTSQSQELMFESMETIPDKQKGARAYMRLALTNSINGHYAASDKYLSALSHTLFHSDFALSFNHRSAELERFRRLRYQGRPYPYNYDYLISELDELVKQCPDNKIAAQYLVALVMLQKDLQYLHYVTSVVFADGTTPLPDVLQQALTVYLVSRDDFDGKIPPYISKDNVKKGMSFINEFDKLGSMSDTKRRSVINELWKKYGNTYYFYYYLQ